MATQNMGLVGLGVMGLNLAMNWASNGVDVTVFDPWEKARTKFSASMEISKSNNIKLTHSISALIEHLPAPRTILLMVKAGEPVDAMITQLMGHLQKGDVLIDGGNSHYLDTIRREAMLNEKGIHFIGLGISGGEQGARTGAALMAGGSQLAYDRVRPMLEIIAARFDEEPCCALLGCNGSGHFIKMVHNGIEYGIMQMIAEAYVLMRDVYGINHLEMAELFRDWNDTDLSSYLIEITADILARKDELGAGPLVEAILDKAGQKGTGRWSSEAALALGVPTPTITQAVFARFMASLKDERVTASRLLKGPVGATDIVLKDVEAIEALRQAVLGAFVAVFAQGFSLIEAGARHQGWQVDLAAVSKVWRNGCIIRARLLDDMSKAFQGEEQPQNLMCAPVFADILAKSEEGWRKTVGLAVQQGVPVPALSSALSYFDGYRTEHSWANLIQAQRDFFGAHTYERADRPGSFHTNW